MSSNNYSIENLVMAANALVAILFAKGVDDQ